MPKKYVATLQLTVILMILYFTSLHSYLLFHSLAEILGIVVSLAIFLIAWNSWRFIDNTYFLIIGVALLFRGVLDTFHVLAYKGMNIFTADPNLATQFWLAARYMMSLTFLLAPFFINKKFRIGRIFVFYAGFTALIFLSVFYFKDFPVAYGIRGLTPFKKISEYFISFFYLASIFTLYLKREKFDGRVIRLIYWSLALKFIGEIFFTLYVGVYDIFNMLGHMIRLAAHYLLYLGIVEIALAKPYRLLFKNLKDSEKAARLNEERYRSIVELSPEAIFVHKDGEFLYMNQACLKLFGAKNEKELMNKKVWELIGHGNKDQFLKVHNSEINQEELITNEEIKISSLDGRSVDVEVKGKIIFYQGAPALQTMMINITQRKKIQETILQEKNKLIKILDSMEDGVYIVNQSFEFEYVNPALKKIFGEVDGRRCYEYFNNRSEKCSWCKMPEILRGERVRWEYYFSKVGKDFDLIDNPVPGDNGNVSKLAIMRDISISKRSEKLIRESERRYRLIFENTGTATMIFDDDSTISLVNSQFSSLSGNSKDEIEGRMKWEDFIAPEDKERLAEYRRIRLIDPTKAPKNYEFKFQTRENNIRSVYATIERMPELKKTIASLIDITDKKQMREILKESEMRYQALGELIPFGIWVCDAKGNPIYLSQSYLNRLGMTLDEYRTIGWNKMVHPEDREVANRDWQKCVSEGIIWTHEHRIMDKSGKYYTIFAKGMPQKDANGQIVSWTGIDLDITERRNVEMALKEAHDNLDQLVQERTKELLQTNEKLIQEVAAREKIEKQLEVRNAILGFLPQAQSRKEYLDLVAGYLKKITGCSYVGLRVIDEEKRIPYESYIGFSHEFWQSENWLSLEKDSCICIRIAAGKPEAVDKPFLTEYGSFYSGDTLALGDSLNEEEKKSFRGTCIKSGFASVAVIPIIDDGRILGVIHLADKEKNKLSQEQIGLMEQLNLLIGEGIAKFDLSDKIRNLNQELEGRVLERTRELQSTNESLVKEVTERRRIEEERAGLLRVLEDKNINIEKLALSLEKERDMLKVIMENTGAHLAYLDRDFNFININSAYSMGTGFTKEELLEKNLFELFPDQENRAIFERVRDTGIPVEIKAKPFIFAHQPWRGTTYWDWTLIPIRGGGNEVIGLVFSSIDVTDRKRDEYNLKVHAEKLEQITDDLKKFQQAVQYASDLIIITDPEGKILFANNMAEEMTGYGLEEIIGHTPSLWGDEAAEEFYAEALYKVKENKAPFRSEVINSKKGGEKFIGDLHISPILNEEKEVIFFVGIMRDITLAKAIDEAKNEFISMASHQLRTPLTSVGLSVELLIRGIYDKLDERHQGYLKEIHNSTRRMTDLISALLNVSRIEMGTFAVRLEFLEIVGLVDRITEELNEQFLSKNLKLEKDFKLDSFDTNFDPNIFRIVFENIVTNAIRYTPAGGKITVGIDRTDDNLVISVKDTGVGIPKEDQEKIFMKSYRSEAAKKVSSDGTGLGLYIARSVARKVGADIWVESEEGKGSTFYFGIPAEK